MSGTMDDPPPPGGGDAWKVDILAVADRADEAAFARLFRHFAPRIKAFAVRGGADPQTAEEIAQETMAAAWRKARLFDPAKTHSVAAWLFTIARNQRIDRFRRERRPEPDPYDRAYTPDPAPPPDESADVARTAERIAAALTRLPAAQREALLLSFYEDEPHASIAAKLGVPLGTVKSRLRLALVRLRAALSQDEGVAK